MQDVIKQIQVTWRKYQGRCQCDQGVASRREYRGLPVHVSFSGGKDSFEVLDLTVNALKSRNIRAFFLNTGIEFPETVEFARNFCSSRG
jgi:phosphoadenosine phosphosulfate reductase